MPRRRRTPIEKRPRTHRSPPIPESWNSPKGTCRFCGQPIIDNGKQNFRKNWHRHCVHEWKIMSQPSYAKRAIHVRDKGKCQMCGFFSVKRRDFDLDHIDPLFESHQDVRYWLEENLQLLCKPCHKEKTREDVRKWRQIYGPIRCDPVDQ